VKRKVLIFIEDGSFTYDNRVKKIANSLYQNDFELTIISPRTKGDPLFKKIDDKYRAIYFPKFEAESILFHLIEHLISIFFGFILTFVVKIRYGFNVFYACNPTDILWIIALPYKLFGTKFIFDQHDLCPELYLSRFNTNNNDIFYKLLLWLEKKSYKHADKVISTNDSYKKVAINRGNKKDTDIFVVRNGPLIEKFSNIPKAETTIKENDEILVGYLGNMNPQDGVDELLYAAYNLIIEGNIHNMKFILIGGGSYQPTLQKLSVELGLYRFVRFTGRIPDDEMLRILSKSDICVQPDPYNPLNDISTMNKVMEYMALGKPVVAFSLKETMISGSDIVLYANKNRKEELAEKILFLAQNPKYRKELGQRGRKRVKEKLEWMYSVPNLLQVFKSLY